MPPGTGAMSDTEQLWRVELQHKFTQAVLVEEILASPPMAQASAEVSALKKYGDDYRCTHSRFIRDTYIRKEIRELIERGSITVEENESIACNSYERQAMIPALTNEAFLKQMRYCLGQCGYVATPATTYDDAIKGVYAPELLKRFDKLLRSSAVLAMFDPEHYVHVFGDPSELTFSKVMDRAIGRAQAKTENAVSADHKRTPDGHINNCALANDAEEKSCQICGGTCPDRERYQGGLGVKP